MPQPAKMRTAHGMCLLLCGQSECDWADAARLTSVIGALLLFAAPGDRVIGFEVEVGPVLLDPGGRVVEVVKPSRRWLGLGLLGRRGSSRKWFAAFQSRSDVSDSLRVSARRPIRTGTIEPRSGGRLFRCLMIVSAAASRLEELLVPGSVG